MSTEFRLYAPEGGSVDFDKLIDTLEEKADKAKAGHEGQRRVLEGSYFHDASALQRATTEVSIQAGMEIGFRQSANLLAEVKKQLLK